MFKLDEVFKEKEKKTILNIYNVKQTGMVTGGHSQYFEQSLQMVTQEPLFKLFSYWRDFFKFLTSYFQINLYRSFL